MTRLLAGLLLLALAPATPAGAVAAQERITGYDIAVEVLADGTLDVTEKIRVHAEGEDIRRGIYRDFPTRYKDRHGNRVVVGFEMLGVTRNGTAEPWFTEDRGNGVRINTGNDDFLDVPGEHAYVLHYRTTRQLGFFDDHDELYWNAIGTGWDFPIERASVEVRLPEPVPVAEMRAQGHAGKEGSSDGSVTSSLPAPGVARWELSRPLAPGEGMTVVLTFPKGIVGAPTKTTSTRWFFRDNLGVLVALLGLLGLVAFCTWRWRQVGRDPRAGVVIPRYEPPGGHSPAGLRYMRHMGYDTGGFTADVLALAVSGQLRIHREEAVLADKWSLQRLHGGGEPTGAGRVLLDALFEEGDDTLALEQENAARLQAATRAHAAALKRQYKPAMFSLNGGSSLVALGIFVATFLLATFLSDGAGAAVILACGALMLGTVIAFALLVRAPTPEGRRLLDEIEGLKLYLGVAERDDLARLPGPGVAPPLDAERFQQLLPYAVALDVEDAWTQQFSAAVGAAAATAATAGMAWYSGARMAGIGEFTSAVGSGLNARIAASSSPPGTSSGAGGGFVGGGGGGGGGGGR